MQFPINFTVKHKRMDSIGTHVYVKFYEDSMSPDTPVGFLCNIETSASVDNSYIKISAEKIGDRGIGIIRCTFDPEKWETKKGIKELMNFQKFFILPAYKTFYCRKKPWNTFDISNWVNSDKVPYRWMAVASKELTQEQLEVLLVDPDVTIRLLAQGRFNHKLYKRSR